MGIGDMTSSLVGVSIDARDATALADFWAQALNRHVNERATASFATVSADDASVPSLMFHRVPEEKATINRLHFDLQTTEVSAEVERLIGLGPKRIRPPAVNSTSWVSLIDPEGNEFDLVAISRAGGRPPAAAKEVIDLQPTDTPVVEVHATPLPYN
jgi:predicted enzyme related to lactoylglutathione lyase